MNRFRLFACVRSFGANRSCYLVFDGKQKQSARFRLLNYQFEELIARNVISFVSTILFSQLLLFLLEFLFHFLSLFVSTVLWNYRSIEFAYRRFLCLWIECVHINTELMSHHTVSVFIENLYLHPLRTALRSNHNTNDSTWNRIELTLLCSYFAAYMRW